MWHWFVLLDRGDQILLTMAVVLVCMEAQRLLLTWAGLVCMRKEEG